MSFYPRWVEHIINILKQVARRWILALLLATLLMGLTAEGPPPASISTRARYLLAEDQFNFVGWELEALLSKLAYTLVVPQRYMDAPTRHDFLLEYLTLVSDAQRLEGEIYRVYADPEIEDAAAATVEQRARLAEMRADEDVRQPFAEAILEEQVACLLVDEGFGALGQEIPPVRARFTPLPLLLVISPRDHIEKIFSLGLRAGLGATRREAIESEIEAQFDVSALVTGIGGMAAYPSMLLESSSLNWLTNVTAHEWTHHYLTPRPLGWNYNASPEARTINETVASIMGEEIGRKVIARYYPELLPPEPVPEELEEEPLTPEPPAFDFQSEMRETRVRVDELLAQGKIEEAESYMEDRRRKFVAHGYHIRKLNQAYFAFHGAYAEKPGAAGEDPIGPAGQELRARNSDLNVFVTEIAQVTTLVELQALLEETE